LKTEPGSNWQTLKSEIFQLKSAICNLKSKINNLKSRPPLSQWYTYQLHPHIPDTPKAL